MAYHGVGGAVLKLIAGIQVGQSARGRKFVGGVAGFQPAVVAQAQVMALAGEQVVFDNRAGRPAGVSRP